MITMRNQRSGEISLRALGVVRRSETPRWFAFHIVTRWIAVAWMALYAVAIALGWAH
jgi:hypothetical protein